MSGHSKWATIHRQKEVKDAKRGAAFTKLAQAISIAARREDVAKLNLAIEKARQMNMPKDNINRAIERGTSGAAEAALIEASFEGFAPGGVAVLVEAVTDNKLRTAQQVREIFDRGGGSVGSLGAVAYLFEQEGQVVVSSEGKSVDQIELDAIDAGAEEVVSEGNQVVVSCEKSETYNLKNKLETLGYSVTSAELVMRPMTLVVVENPETQAKIENILGKLEELDDVLKVWTNYA